MLVLICLSSELVRLKMRRQLGPHGLATSLSPQIGRGHGSHLVPDRIVRIRYYALLHLILGGLNRVGSYSFFQICTNNFLDLSKVVLSHLIKESVALSLLLVDPCTSEWLLW